MEKQINIYPYLKDRNDSFDYILAKFLPTIRNRVEDTLQMKQERAISPVPFSDIPNNSNTIDPSVLHVQREMLIRNLEALLAVNH